MLEQNDCSFGDMPFTLFIDARQVVVQYSAAVDTFSQQQQYLLSQQEQAQKADADALIQADSGRIIVTLPPFGAEYWS